MTATNSTRVRSALGTTAVSLGVAAVLWWLGRGALATPPIDSWSHFRLWLGDRSTAEAAIGALRATGVVAASYLAAVSGLMVVAGVAPFEALDRLARSLTPKSLRPFIGLAVGAGVMTAAASMTVPREEPLTRVATATVPSDATATMYIVSESVPIPSVPMTTAAEPTTIPSTTIITDAPTTPVAAPPALPAPAVAPQPASAPTPTAVVERTWTIARGEHLWAVARETLADSWHRAPTDAEIVPYWRELIELNRGRLVDAANPDYVLVGQTFVLPDVPAAR